ncbi:cell division control protein Cdc6 [Halobiforma lacisalsi AJ5]|uniref:ORC1-type DNA replication protein n=1 Tax=Natronobacterium lacisalsi AJ5 TaxID=358396 RepID=M0LV48_NATLA|nr:orc1/cdc6 family replication initiation protein [Halobiforma lacisalsi]APW97609.1 cell division control protein Cdc6 [Halobiforma lacisalsi AJ5]EMA37008.1 cell division control protein 6-like protein [Halobiforma lacisalsi AJ5]
MSDSMDYFGSENEIFRNKELLQVSHLPDGDRIIGREDELSNLANAIKPATRGNTPNNVLVYGKTGTGKSLCSKFITTQAVERAERNDVSIGVAYVDCLQESTETQAVQSAGHQLNDDPETDISIPHSGLSTSEYYRRLWRIIDTRYDVALIILDEVDKIEDDDILMQLSRAVESGKLTSSTVGVIGISNKVRYKDSLDERIKSSLCEREYVFSPYDATQIREILRSRSDAFHEGVLEDGVVPRVAALAAREHGDARKAIDILRFAGEIAEENDLETVTEGCVDQAHEREETSRLAELISKSPSHAKLVLEAMALLTQQKEGDDAPVTTNEAYDLYKRLCERDQSDHLKLRRVRDILSELEFLSIIEQERKWAGKGKGNYMENRLIDDPAVILAACNESE